MSIKDVILFINSVIFLIIIELCKSVKWVNVMITFFFEMLFNVGFNFILMNLKIVNEYKIVVDIILKKFIWFICRLKMFLLFYWDDLKKN